MAHMHTTGNRLLIDLLQINLVFTTKGKHDDGPHEPQNKNFVSGINNVLMEYGLENLMV